MIGVGWTAGPPHLQSGPVLQGGWGVGQRQWEQRVSPLLVSIGGNGCRGMRKQLGGQQQLAVGPLVSVRVPLTTLSTTSVGRSESVSNSPSGSLRWMEEVGNKMDGWNLMAWRVAMGEQ